MTKRECDSCGRQLNESDVVREYDARVVLRCPNCGHLQHVLREDLHGK